jgi:hypothetical protein
MLAERASASSLFQVLGFNVVPLRAEGIVVMNGFPWPHAKGTMIHPRFLMQILNRFDIAVADFLEEIGRTRKGPQQVAS